MDTTYIKKQLKRYRKLRRRDEFVARVKGYFKGFGEEGVAMRLIRGGLIVAGIFFGAGYLFSLLKK